MLLTTILMLPIGLMLGRYIYMAVVKMPKTYLVPMVTLMLLIGAFAIQNSYDDVVIMFCLGVLAWVIGRFGYPAAPVVLGLLLGPIAEQGYAQALMIGRAKEDIPNMFFGSTVSVVLICCIVASIFLPPLLRRLSVLQTRQAPNV